MITKMQDHFVIVDGIDLREQNLGHARQRLSKHKADSSRYSLYHSDVFRVSRIDKKYDFIYSTIAQQHISVHAIRHKIITDLYSLLNERGSCCLQLGFGWGNGNHWFDNRFAAWSTNAGVDVTIPNKTYVEGITADLKGIGFTSVRYEFKSSPHPEFNDSYHPTWIYIHMSKK